MENRNMLEELTRYRVKIEKDGKNIADVPGILCLPGLLAAPKLGIAGLIAAPLLGLSVHMENRDGSRVNVEEEMRKAAESVVNTAGKTAETVLDTAGKAAKTIREEIERVWQDLSADDPEEVPEGTENDGEAVDPAEVKDPENAAGQEASEEKEAIEEIVEDLKKQEKREKPDVPTIQVNPEDSEQA